MGLSNKSGLVIQSFRANTGYFLCNPNLFYIIDID